MRLAHAGKLLVIFCWCLSFTTGAANPVRDLPQQPIFLWSEKPPVTPDREHMKDQRLYAVDNSSLTPYWPAQLHQAMPAVVIFPGGGYVRLALDLEGTTVARWFAARGVAAFVVKYRMQEYGYPAPLQDGQRAVRLLRQHANEWGLDPNRIGVVGFSAGGHLAASVATLHQAPVTPDDPLASISARPDFMVLGYPVITFEGEDAHAGSRRALLGENPSASLIRTNSLQHQVRADIPPVFIFHGLADQAVPVGNSLSLFDEVRKFNRQSELHIYQTGIHGVGMVQGQGSVSRWPEAMEAWLKERGIIGQ